MVLVMRVTGRMIFKMDLAKNVGLMGASMKDFIRRDRSRGRCNYIIINYCQQWTLLMARWELVLR